MAIYEGARQRTIVLPLGLGLVELGLGVVHLLEQVRGADPDEALAGAVLGDLVGQQHAFGRDAADRVGLALELGVAEGSAA